jgi:iron complex outermembrane receptor protein
MADFNFDLLGIGADRAMSACAGQDHGRLDRRGQRRRDPQRGDHRQRNTDTLPSMNLTPRCRPNVLLRLSAGKTLSRPEYTDLAPGHDDQHQTQNVSIGNPDLDPIRAKTYDLQAEWYFAKDSLISVGLLPQGHRHLHPGRQRAARRIQHAGPGPSVLVSGGCSLTAAPQCPTLPDHHGDREPQGQHARAARWTATSSTSRARSASCPASGAGSGCWPTTRT